MTFARPPLPVGNTKVSSVRLRFDGGIDIVSQSCDLTLATAQLCYNVICGKYGVKSGWGIDYLTDIKGNKWQFGQKLKGFWYAGASNGGNYIAHLEDNKLYFVDAQQGTLSAVSQDQFDTYFQSFLFTFEEGEGLVLTDGSKCIVLVNNAMQQIAAPSFCIGEVHSRRLFVASGKDDVLHFCAPANATDWTTDGFGAGNITLANGKGNIVALSSYKNYLYIFCQRGVTKAEIHGNASEFELTECNVNCGTIHGNTVKACGEKIVFVADNGLYSFDGTKAVQLLSGISNLFDKQSFSSCVAQYHNGKYILAFRANFGDNNKVLCEFGQYVNNALLIYDTTDSNYSIMRGADVCEMYVYNSSLLLNVRYNNSVVTGCLSQSGKLFDNSMPKLRISAPYRFDSLDKKFVRYVEVGKVCGDVQLVVVSDGTVNLYAVQRSNLPQKIMVRTQAQEFAIGIVATSATFEVDTLNIVYTTSQ